MNIDMKKIIRQVLVKFPSFGHRLANIKMCPTNQIETAAIEGNTMYYNPIFMDGLTEKQQAFIVSHEICHKELQHIERSLGKNPTLWNIATDAVINAYLKQAGLEMIPGCVDIPNAYNMRAEDLYQKLLEEAQNKGTQSKRYSEESQKKNNEDSQEEQSEERQEDNQGEHHEDSKEDNQENHSEERQEDSQEEQSEERQEDSQEEQSEERQEDNQGEHHEDSKEDNQENHSEERQEDSQEEKYSGKNDASLGDDENITLEESESEHGNFSLTQEQENEMKEKYGEGHTKHQDWQEKAKHIKAEDNKPEDEIDDREVFSKNQEEKKKRQEQLRKNMVEDSMKVIGQEASSSTYEMSDVEERKAILDWKKILKASLVGNQYDYRLSKRVRNGVIPYELKKLPEPCTEILLDTSGSISETLLRNFLSECLTLLKTSRMKVGCFDTEFYGFHEIRSKKDIQNMKIEGRGGTDFDVAVNAFSSSAENKIIFTDGCADTPHKKCKATWVIFEEDSYYKPYIDNMNPPGGTKVFIPYEQYRELAYESNEYYDDYDDYDYYDY